MPKPTGYKLLLISLTGMIVVGYDSKGQTTVSDSLSVAAQRTLREVLHRQSEWVKVHAAEYLLWAGFPDGVKAVFMAEEKQYGHQSPYRIGIWRVLAQAATTTDEREKRLDRIQQAFQDPAGPDRIHAAETLAKLRTPPTVAASVTRAAIESDNPALSLYTRWAASYHSDDSVALTRKYLLAGLANQENDALTKRMSAYILRHLDKMTDAQWQQLAQIALAEPDASDAQTYLLSAAFVLTPAQEADTDAFVRIREKLLKAQNSPRKGDRTEMAMALAECGTSHELPVLTALLNNQNPLPTAPDTSPELSRKDADNADVRAAAAYAILKIGQRIK